MGKDKRKTAHSENESSARDSNVIDAWFRLQKANSMTLLVTTIRSYHNTLNEDPLITLMNPRIPSAYTCASWSRACCTIHPRYLIGHSHYKYSRLERYSSKMFEKWTIKFSIKNKNNFVWNFLSKCNAFLEAIDNSNSFWSCCFNINNCARCTQI